jgi:hypothetical protein
MSGQGAQFCLAIVSVKSWAAAYSHYVCLLAFNWPVKETARCVPDFSTFDPNVVKEMVAEIEKVPLTCPLDYSFDDYYNRLVVVVGSGNPCFEPP